MPPKSKGWLMALDAGTGSGRCLLWEPRSGRVVSAQRAWEYSVPGEIPGGLEFDAGYFWKQLCTAVKEAMARAGAAPSEILAVSTTSQRQGMVLLNGRGEVIWATPNRDYRANLESAELAQGWGPRIFSECGRWPRPLFACARLLWLRRHRPQVFSAARHLLMINDWLIFQLTGELSGEPTNAAETALFNIYKRDWNQDLMEALGISPGLFPPLFSCGEKVSGLTPEAARQTGLCQGTPVIAGAADTHSALIGSGVVKTGEASLVAGTTAPLQMVIESPCLDLLARLWTSPHPLDGRWVLESNLGVAGMALRWLADLLFAGQRTAEPCQDGSIPRLLRAAEQAPPGSGGVMMLLGPRLYDGKYAGPRRGGFFVPSLSSLYELPNPAACLSRAFLENLACAARGNMEQIREVSGFLPRRLVFSGGMAQSDLLAQITAEVSGLVVEVPREIETTALGAAILAGVGAGYFSDIEQGIEAAVVTAKEFHPHGGQKDFYQKLFADWRHLHGQISRWEPAPSAG